MITYSEVKRLLKGTETDGAELRKVLEDYACLLDHNRVGLSTEAIAVYRVVKALNEAEKKEGAK